MLRVQAGLGRGTSTPELGSVEEMLPFWERLQAPDRSAVLASMGSHRGMPNVLPKQKKMPRFQEVSPGACCWGVDPRPQLSSDLEVTEQHPPGPDPSPERELGVGCPGNLGSYATNKCEEGGICLSCSA